MLKKNKVPLILILIILVQSISLFVLLANNARKVETVTEKIDRVMEKVDGVAEGTKKVLPEYLRSEHGLVRGFMLPLYQENGMEFTWWEPINNEDQKKIAEKKYGITLPDNDFTKNNLAISLCRELKEITYLENSKNYSMVENHYIGEPLFGRKYDAELVYIYRIEKNSFVDIYKMGGLPLNHINIG